MDENKLPFWKRFLIYQKERFPFLFQLPVPKGLISLKELKWVGVFIVIVQVMAIWIIHPTMFLFYIIVMAYLALMTVEFFMHDWLNSHIWAYVGSHMMIIPLVDIYASGLDWFLDDGIPHLGLLFFFGVSYFNGIVLEIGRKLKTPNAEREGVVTYSGTMGFVNGANLWIVVLTVTAMIASAACYYAHLAILSYYILALFYMLGVYFAIRYKNEPNERNSKNIEIVSGVWTLLMYGTLGGVVGLINYLF